MSEIANCFNGVRSRPKVGVITFLEAREKLYQRRKELIEEEDLKLVSRLESAIDLVSSTTVRFREDALRWVREPEHSGVDCFILHVPSWTAPDLVLTVANNLTKPFLLLGNDRAETASLVGWLAAAGSFDQVGLSYGRVLGDVSVPSLQRSIIAFCRAASAVSGLRGQTFCSFGWRSLGMYTGVADLAQWQKLFGLDIQVFDQLEIVRAAEEAASAHVEHYMDWLRQYVGVIEFDGSSFTEERLRKQIRSYLGTKKLISQRGCDFLGIKCQTELSDGYVLQCLNVALLNDPYDAEGPKKPVIAACEADHDGALTMQILHLLSGGEPVTLMDVKDIRMEQKVMVFANCGGMATYFAGGSCDARQNLKLVHLRPHIFGEAGGGATQFIATSGRVTLARLCRRDGRYWMAIVTGDFVERSRDDIRRTGWPWPHAFLHTDIDFESFLATFGSNHMHAVRGDYRAELEEFCRMTDVPCKVY